MRSRGTASVEFALLLPFSAFLLAGVIDGGVFMVETSATARAARDGARVGAMTLETPPATGSKIEGAATAAAVASMKAAGFAAGGIDVTSEWFEEDDTSWVRVQVTCAHHGFFGGLTPFGHVVSHQFFMVTQEQL